MSESVKAIRTREKKATKRCARCKQIKPVDNFGKCRSRKDGLQPYCKECIAMVDREYYTKNHERINTRNAKWRKDNPEKAKVSSAKWREENAVHVKVYSKRYYIEHKEEAAAYHAKLMLESPEKEVLARLHRHARKYNVPGSITIEQLFARWEFYGGRCYICGKLAEAVDHVIPLSVGGPNWPANLRPICAYCNSVKGATWPYDFVAARAISLSRARVRQTKWMGR